MKLKILSWNVRGVNDPENGKSSRILLEFTEWTWFVFKKLRCKKRIFIWYAALGWGVS